MIAALIRWSIANRLLVLIATVMVSAWGVVSVYKTPLDALCAWGEGRAWLLVFR